MKLKPVTHAHPPELRDEDAEPPRTVPRGDDLDAAMDKQGARLKDLQQLFYADGRYAMLVVFQGRDASGKDGVIKKVIGAVNPMGCEITSFKAPTEFERKHDFLWRIHARTPAHGTIGVFNRSHYEDVLAVRVHKLLPKKVWSRRFDQINEFERSLSLNNTVILKFMLHVSRNEQKKRLKARVSDVTKNWKFRTEDLDDRAKWNDYTSAYRDALSRCSTKWAPWFVVPADDKDARDYMVARTIVDTLDDLDLRFPKAPKDVRKIRIV